MKKYFLLSFLLGITAFSVAQEKTIKNVILLIPDGTSLATVSAARWYQRYIHPEQTSLKIDPYICGTIFTYSSNAPIGDSAPTTSCYMTGYPSRAGFVATYPPADPKNDIFPMNVYEPYQPMITLMEAARMAQQKATGLVFTCEFPHATPADCSAHSYDREKYDRIIPQMVHNQLDVVIGGGVPWLVTKEDSTYFKYLKKNNYSVLTNDTSFQHDPANKMWALFGGKNGMDYELDRNPAKQPSLAEMTQVAINKLSQNPNGFVLMVEGSKVDWAAHANDAAAMFTEMIAFDKACGVALDFAERNGETLIVIVPDHGNSGFSIGSPKCGDYHHTTKDELFGPISQIKISRDRLVKDLIRNKSDIKEIMQAKTGILLTDDEYTQILNVIADKTKHRTDSVVAKILNDHNLFGFIYGGHTGEEVFLAVYDPRPGQRMTGHHSNIELNHYLRESLDLGSTLEDLTKSCFAKHTAVFNSKECTINKEDNQPVLTVKHKKKVLEIPAYTNIVKFNGKEIPLNSVIVYVDQNDTFYLPQSLAALLE